MILTNHGQPPDVRYLHREALMARAAMRSSWGRLVDAAACSAPARVARRHPLLLAAVVAGASALAIGRRRRFKLRPAAGRPRFAARFAVVPLKFAISALLTRLIAQPAAAGLQTRLHDHPETGDA